jgi:RHS repeat-associated protein
MGGCRRALSRLVAALVVFVSIIAGVAPASAQPSQEPEDPEAPEWLGEQFGGYQASRPDDDPVSPPVEPARSAPRIEDTPVDPTDPVLPEPGVAEVTLGEAGAARGAGDAPIELTAGSAAAEGASLRVEVLDRAVAQRAGVSGMVFTLAPSEGEPALAEELPLEVAIDVAGFEGLYGSGYTDRLRVAALPACALADVRPEGCDTAGVALPVERDYENDRLIVEVEDLSRLTAAGLEGDVPVEPPASSTPTQETPAEDPTTTTTTTTEAPSTTTTSAPEAAPGDDAPDETTTTATTTAEGPEAPESDEPEGDTAGEPAAAGRGPGTAALASVRQPDPEGEVGDEPASVTQLDPLSGGGVVFALLAGVSGDEGTFAATPLSLTSDWQVGEGSGEFNWNYPIPVPAPPAGPAPDVAVAYSSGSVDGMVTTRNTQSGRVGLGWADFASSFIERRYAPCYQEAGVAGMGSQCWKTDNATISLNGRASELVPVPATTNQWRLRDDPNWRVERFTVADDPAMDNGDNDGEHWRVTSPDGTEYWFGLGRNPDTSDETLSTFTVPVVGDDATDPCYAAGSPMGWCQQAWRWNLDRVVDPNDNEAVYYYGQETNHYNAGTGYGILPYVRAGRLVEIWYGKRAGTQQLPTAKVLFDADWRCGSLDEEGQPPCPEPTAANGTEFPDVPNDLICGATTCANGSPSFFTGLRYTEILTQIQTEFGVDDYADVDRIDFTHTFQQPDPGAERYQLWLTGIQRTGLTGPSELAMPPIALLGGAFDNRADPPSGGSSMPHHRLQIIVDEFGRQILVDYGQPDPCPDPLPTSGWDTNTKNCFPQQWTPDGASQASFAIFHKYLVEDVTVQDPNGGTASPAMVYDYQYDTTVEGAWHHDDDELVPNSDQSWSDWRGYATVTVVNGTSRTTTRVFRGMHGDRLAGDPVGGPGTKTASLTPLDGASAVTDSNWLAGRVLDTAQRNGSGNTVVGTLTTYVAEITANSPAADPNEDARWVAPATVTERRRTPVAGFASRRTTTAYTSNRQPWFVLEDGWLDQTGDERCTGTSYATNTSLFMLSYKSEEVVVEGNCSSTTERRRSQFHYDGGGLNIAPTRGDVTASRSRITSSTWTPYATTTYDPLGRALVATDANAHTTTTSYTPTSGNPESTSVENHLSHTQTTAWNVIRGVPASETDANGNVTSYAYDGLGRVTQVRQPTEQGTGPASWEFEYTIDLEKNGPHIVRTRQLVDPATPSDPYIDSWTVYDANLRERQTHRDSPAAGKVIVTNTTYDNRGNPASVSLPQAVTPGTAQAAGSGILGSGSWANTTRSTYDELSRPTNEEFFQNATERWQTTTSHTHNSTTVQPPTGGATLTVTDAYDRVVRVEEQDGSNWRPTAYTYNAPGDLLTVTDPASNVITNTYDMLGRRTAMDDPDAGDWTYAYDPVGNQTRSTDATGTQLHTIYDPLNRPTERRQTSTTGPVLASWDYDATGELGLLNSSTRHHATGDWIVDVAGYDDRSRPTGRTWTVPAGITALAGTYTVGYGYDRADHQTSVSYPAVGGLAQETVTTTYNTLGLAETMIGDDDYLWGAVYDDRARPQWFLSGDTATPFNRVWQYDADQRLARMQAAGGSTPLQDHQFAYDDTGNITERNTFLAGDAWRECFDYDDRQRLTGAFTTSGTCAAGTPGTGDAPYQHTYTYSVDGNLTSRDEGATTYDYTYPSSGGTRPHAPTDVEGDTYTWNANGDLDTRSVNGQTHDLTWDPERRLATVDDPDGDTTHIYDADGNRLLRQTPDNTTLYIEGHEITRTGASTTAVRSYPLDGQIIATRAGSTVEYVAADQQGSIQVTVETAATAATAARAYLPYGGPRTTDTTDTDRGWIGQIEDGSTALNYLNNRYYDANLYRFISPDALYQQDRPQSLNPYQYGLNNPAINGDPTGLEPRPWWNPNFDGATFDYVAYGDGYGNPIRRPTSDVSSYESGREVTSLIGSEMNANVDHHYIEGYRNGREPCSPIVMVLMPSCGTDVRAVSLGQLMVQFRTGGDWDHKPDINEISGDSRWIMIDSQRAVRFDVFSNMHFGYVLAAAEMPREDVIGYANLGEEVPILQPIVGDNDEVDDIAMGLGYDMFSDENDRIEVAQVRNALVGSFESLEQAGGACFVDTCP